MNDRSDYISFITKQLPKVYYPALVWSLPLYVLTLLSGESIWKSTVLLIICGFSIYYFVAFIMQCYIFLPVVNQLNLSDKSKLSWGG